MMQGGDGRTLDLDFTSGVLDSRITFSRASTTATYINSSGYVTTASTNIPRFDYAPDTLAARGLLIEGQATNLIYWSEAFDTSGAAINWNWSALNVTRGTATTTSPTGSSATVIKIQETTATGVHAPLIVYGTLTSSAYTVSLFAKAVERQYLQLFDNGGSSANAMFNLSGSGTVVSESTAGIAAITPYPNGWYRISMRTPTLTNMNIQFRLSTNGTTTSYAGTLNSGCYIWGAQLEAASVASSYIPTGASQVTRNADDASMTGTAFSSWFNASSGTIQANFRRRLTSTTGRMVSANDNTANNWIELGASTTGRWAIQQGGASQANIAPGTVAANTDYKIAGAYDTNDAQAALGGTLGTADTSVTVPTVDRLFIGRDSGASPVYLDGTISRLIYWPFRQPNATLQSLTQ